MKDAATRKLFDYWSRRRGRCWAPERSNIDPTDIRHVLGDTFMLTADFVDGIRFRLASDSVFGGKHLDNFAFKVVFDLLVSLGVVSDNSECAEPSPRWITAGDGVTIRVETIS